MNPPVTPAPPLTGRLPANPFATRHTRPGTIAALDDAGVPLDIAALVNRCLNVPAACIEAPHGHGKTTILLALVGQLESRGVPVAVVRLRTMQDGWWSLATVLRAVPGTLVCVDGWERAGRLFAVAIRAVARCRRVRLVVTAHRATGLPVVLRCATSPRLLAAVVERLPDHGGRITSADIADAYARHGGNLRESLYDLYDRFERRIR